jgi:hypothetical protein
VALFSKLKSKPRCSIASVFVFDPCQKTNTPRIINTSRPQMALEIKAKITFLCGAYVLDGALTSRGGAPLLSLCLCYVDEPMQWRSTKVNNHAAILQKGGSFAHIYLFAVPFGALRARSLQHEKPVYIRTFIYCPCIKCFLVPRRMMLKSSFRVASVFGLHRHCPFMKKIIRRRPG